MSKKRFRHNVSKHRAGRNTNEGTPGTVVMFPGLSLMQAVQVRPDALFVRCPGCGASATFTTVNPPRAFGHEDDSCSVLRRIQAVMAQVQAAIVVETGWN